MTITLWNGEFDNLPIMHGRKKMSAVSAHRE